MVSQAVKTYIQKIEATPYHEEKLILTVRGFIDVFPFMGAVLYNYSMLSHVGEGILWANREGLTSIRDLREDMRNIPPIHAAIREKKTLLLRADQLRQIPARHVHGASYAIIVPICHGSNVLGWAGTSGHPDGCEGISCQLVDDIAYYGQQVAKVLTSEQTNSRAHRLSKREVEVLQLLSWGQSIKEMADRMGISEFTIQDYIKSALKKLNVQNRTQGVAEALRQRIIL
jgi:DNA-binding CsgD family transcriptional regulator